MNVINVIIFELTLLLLEQTIVTDGERWIGSEETVTARPISQIIKVNNHVFDALGAGRFTHFSAIAFETA